MLNKKDKEEASKTLSYILRHRPDEVGIKMDNNGWCDVQSLVNKLNNWAGSKYEFSEQLIETLVQESDKQRFALTVDKKRIRANQGHSVKVDLDLQPVNPPDKLYHGTIANNLQAIKLEGLKPMSRNHIHLSLDIDTATKVGMRYGKPVILVIDAKKMHEDGYLFYRSENNVYLTGSVNSAYIKNLDEEILKINNKIKVKK